MVETYVSSGAVDVHLEKPARHGIWWSSRRWSVNVRNSDPRDSGSYRGMIYLTDVRTRDVQDIEEIARGLRLNRFSGWNCQDFVKDLLEALEDEAIIDPSDDEYQEQKDRLRRLLHRRA